MTFVALPYSHNYLLSLHCRGHIWLYLVCLLCNSDDSFRTNRSLRKFQCTCHPSHLARLPWKLLGRPRISFWVSGWITKAEVWKLSKMRNQFVRLCGNMGPNVWGICQLWSMSGEGGNVVMAYFKSDMLWTIMTRFAGGQRLIPDAGHGSAHSEHWSSRLNAKRRHLQPPSNRQTLSIRQTRSNRRQA